MSLNCKSSLYKRLLPLLFNIIYSHPLSRFTRVGNIVFGRIANLGGASSWEIKGP
jgi:hypothetical protein